LLSFVVIGGGLVGIELMGELTEFVHNLLRSYPRIPREAIRFFVIEANPRILPEMEEDLAHYAADRLGKRGVSLITGTRVPRMEQGKVYLPPGTQAVGAKPTGSQGESVIESETVILAAGVSANPLLSELPL